MTWDETLSLLAPCLPQEVSAALQQLPPYTLHEIRFRAQRPVQLCCTDGIHPLAITPTQKQIACICEALTGHSLYARSTETAQGYVTLQGGHRLGLCGQAHQTADALSLQHIGSFCLRIATEHIGSGTPLLPHAQEGLLIIGPPGSGKTTLLRDLARLLSTSSYQVALMDERCELSASAEGRPMLNVGCADVLCGVSKPDAARWLIRSMAPQFLVTDEIATTEDAAALADAFASGVQVLSSVHGRSLNEVVRRSAVKPLILGRIFGSYAVLSCQHPGTLVALYDRSGSPLPLP